MKKLISMILTIAMLLSVALIVIPTASAEASGMTFTETKFYKTTKTMSTAPLTFEATLKFPTSMQGTRGGDILSNYGNGNPVISFEITAAGNPRLYLENAGASVVENIVFETVNVYTGAKLHLAIVVESAAIKCYVNGDLKETLTKAVTVTAGGAKMCLGGDHRGSGMPYFRGELFNVALYSDVRTATEIAGDVTTQGTDNLLLHYVLSGGEMPATVADNSGNGYTQNATFTVNNGGSNPGVGDLVAAAGETKAEFTPATNVAWSTNGTLQIAAGSGVTVPSAYTLWWSKKGEKLTGYSKIASVTTGGAANISYTLDDNGIVPSGADAIVIYGSGSAPLAYAALPENAGTVNFGVPLFEMQVMSDVHLQRASAGVAQNAKFENALNQVAALSPNSIGIFINGDVTDYGEADEFQEVWNIVSRVKTQTGVDFSNRVFATVGNHDYYDCFSNIYGASEPTCWPHELSSQPNSNSIEKRMQQFLDGMHIDSDTIYYDKWINDTHFIFLASEDGTRNDIWATLSDEQLAWFETKIKEDREANKPVYVFLHQGIRNTVTGTSTADGWYGIHHGTNMAGQSVPCEQKLLEILKKYPEVVLFTGHSHFAMDKDEKNFIIYDGNYPTNLNTAAIKNLTTANGYDGNGAQGYFITAYEDKVVFSGRDFTNNCWMGSVQYVLDLDPAGTAADPDKYVTTVDLNRTELNKAINECGEVSIDKKYYTAQSYTAYENALASARNIHKNATAQGQIDSAVKALKDAYGALALLAKNAAQQKFVETETAELTAIKGNSKYYTAATLKAYEDAVKALKKTNTQYDCELATAKVTAAKEKLVLIKASDAQIDKLENKILEAEALGNNEDGKYTAESWNVYKAALENATAKKTAKDLLSIDTATKSLQTAIDGLTLSSDANGTVGDSNTNNNETDKPSEEKNGCGSVIGLGGTALLMVMMAGVACSFKKKED